MKQRNDGITRLIKSNPDSIFNRSMPGVGHKENSDNADY